MARDLGLADRIRAAGVDVVEVAGWQTRGSESFRPRGSVNHHTAGPRAGTVPSLRICTHGRADLPGPLCQVLLGRDLRAYVIAAGRANHAGPGGWRGLAGNSSVYGLEVEHVGTTAEPVSDELIEAMAAVHAAFLCGVEAPDPGLVCQHAEWAPRRKVDFIGLDGPTFRALVARHLEGSAPTPVRPPPGDDMPLLLIQPQDRPDVWITDLVTRSHVPSEAALEAMQFDLRARGLDATVLRWPAWRVDSIPRNYSDGDHLQLVAGVVNSVVAKLPAATGGSVSVDPQLLATAVTDELGRRLRGA